MHGDAHRHRAAGRCGVEQLQSIALDREERHAVRTRVDGDEQVPAVGQHDRALGAERGARTGTAGGVRAGGRERAVGVAVEDEHTVGARFVRLREHSARDRRRLVTEGRTGEQACEGEAEQSRRREECGA